MDDLISRAEAIKALGEEPIVLDCDPYEEGMHRQWKDDVNAIKELPSAQRTGKWIYSNDFHWYVASCNKCGYQRRTDIKAEGWNQWNYCPMCGCRMVEE